MTLTLRQQMDPLAIAGGALLPCAAYLLVLMGATQLNVVPMLDSLMMLERSGFATYVLYVLLLGLPWIATMGGLEEWRRGRDRLSAAIVVAGAVTVPLAPFLAPLPF